MVAEGGLARLPRCGIRRSAGPHSGPLTRFLLDSPPDCLATVAPSQVQVLPLPFCNYEIEKPVIKTGFNFVVAEGGLEPPTSGLSLRAGLRSPYRAAPSLALYDRCPMSPSLLPPPAALGLHSQRATLIGLITRRAKDTILHCDY